MRDTLFSKAKLTPPCHTHLLQLSTKQNKTKTPAPAQPYPTGISLSELSSLLTRMNSYSYIRSSSTLVLWETPGPCITTHSSPFQSSHLTNAQMKLSMCQLLFSQKLSGLYCYCSCSTGQEKLRETRLRYSSTSHNSKS